MGAHVSSPGALLSIGQQGALEPADPGSLRLDAVSLTASGAVGSGELHCRGGADVDGSLSVGGDASIGGKLELGGSLDVRGNRVTNAYLTGATFHDAVNGDLEVGGGLRVGDIASAAFASGRGSTTAGPSSHNRGDTMTDGPPLSDGRARILVASPRGDLNVAKRLEYIEDEGVLFVNKLSGHEVSVACIAP